VLWLTPSRFASLRVLQCVSPLSLVSKVVRMISSTFSSVSLRFTFGLGRSWSAAIPPATNRRRQLETVAGVTPTSAAISLPGVPAAAARMIRALERSWCETTRPLAYRSRSLRS
jgi:hypothetical protein